MKQTVKRTMIASAAVSLLLSPLMVSAKDGLSSGGTGPSHVVSSSSSPSPSPSASPSASGAPHSREVEQFKEQLQEQLQKATDTRKAAPEVKMEEIKQKLDDTKRKVCELHQEQINTIIDNMGKRRQSAFNRISQVATAVEAFYVKKQLTIANYDELVGKVEAAKVAAAAAMASQQAAPTIDCSGEHPKSDLTDFKLKRASSTDAMTIYRQTVKDLVKAVKAAAEAEKATATTTPTPTTTPTKESAQ